MLYIAAARLPLYIVIKHLIGTRRVQEASPPPLPALYTRSHFMDVNIRLTIEPAAFFNVSLLPDSNKITSRSSKTVRTHILSLRPVVSLGEKRETIASPALPPRESLEPLPTGNCL